MSKSQFGTVHERYLGSGIMFLSQIEVTSPHESYLCQKEQREIENQFRRGACKPWLPEYRLKAEISQSQWGTRDVMEEKRFGRYDLPKLWFKDAGIRIVESVARLEAARSSAAAELKKVFNLLETEERWWVVDFFEHDNVHCDRVALDWKQEAVRSFFYPPTREWGATRPSRKDLLTTDIYKDARQVSKIPGVADAFRALSQLPSLWNTKAFTYLYDVRRSFCHEEVENYLWAIVDQWREITLNWDPTVVKCVDFKSIRSLQSRAPCFSKNDLKYVRNELQLRQILPLLEEPALREQVELAICRQGPMLTLETFAKDVRLLQLRIRGPLNHLVLGTSRKPDNTLRKEICEVLGNEIDQISGTMDLPNATDAEKQALIRRCYQHVFLYAIRTKQPMERKDLRSVVKQEIELQCIHEREHGLQSEATNPGVIATQAPADDLPDIEVDIERRHGYLLFNESEATKHLYWDRIDGSCVLGLPLTHSCMAKHIVRIFLLGRAASERTQTPPLSLPTVIDQPACTVANLTPLDISPISVCASEDFNHSPISPTCTATPTILNIRSVQKGRAQACIAEPRSMAASLFSAELSPASSTHSSNRVTTKRSASIATLDNPQQTMTGHSRPIKRLRHQGWYIEGEQNDVLLETRNTGYRSRSASVRSVLPQTTGMVSPSVYSMDGSSSIFQRDAGRFSGSIDLETCAQDYVNLLPKCDPYPDQSSNSGTQPQMIMSSPRYTDKLTVARHPPSKLRLGTPANKTTQELQIAGYPKEAPGFILYKLLEDGNIVQRAPRTKDSTERFVASQKKLDPDSKFLYRQNGEVKHASNAEQLYHAIKRLGLHIVFVDSGKLSYEV